MSLIFDEYEKLLDILRREEQNELGDDFDECFDIRFVDEPFLKGNRSSWFDALVGHLLRNRYLVPNPEALIHIQFLLWCQQVMHDEGRDVTLKNADVTSTLLDGFHFYWRTCNPDASEQEKSLALQFLVNLEDYTAYRFERNSLSLEHRRGRLTDAEYYQAKSALYYSYS
ncbi:unnamed protein product [Ambrosiozyma monospora]|uniref:Unnamed protein product n=1 Tax=Ambrosiozyma monospora TaxID=43982 RepID=A0A9W6TAZ9_AMBMO|nr:unnamed protein product [Ambrosiozyma monospora]